MDLSAAPRRLHLYRSNRLETLAKELAGVLRQPLASPLQPELVVVQSLGMRRWLTLQVAERLGVAMNIAFPFPGELIERVFSAAFPERTADRSFDRAVLPWRILGAFEELLGAPGFEDLQRYAEGEMGSLKTYQLAGKIAGVFDRYLAYRPELITAWQRGEGHDWQARLWRALHAKRASQHPPELAAKLPAALRERTDALAALPPRIAIFGISSLPPFYVQILGELAHTLEIHLFELAPTDLYWGDVASPKEQDRILRRYRARGWTAEDLHLEAGHGLLASLGKVGRDFSKLLIDLEPTHEIECFTAPEPTTLLRALQADIFTLQQRPAGEKAPVAKDDRSLQIHCCHSPMRELEVLHDQLLALFDADPKLTPKDILVTMPDVATYAPFIEAVFGTPESPELQIPFSIADRGSTSESTIAETFLQILDLAGSRFGAATVLGLLEVHAIQRRFRIAPGDLDLIRGWLRRTGIRWGIDPEHRAALDLPRFPDNTWRGGLRRLLLGYALPGDDETLFGGVLPVREIEGSLAAALGQFVEFAETLFDIVERFQKPRSLREWARTFRETLGNFFDESGESIDEIRALRRVFDKLATLQSDADFASAVDFAVIRAHLGTALDELDSGSGFLAGRVTFCALKPMRSIPFKVLCMLGMDDGAFPRRDAALAFDLVATQPRLGDRSLREDDRQLFLESILSARDVLSISYSGLSLRDNSQAPPSVLVGELLEHLQENFAPPAAGWITRHRLQPFSPEYFERTSALFSYSQENCRASERGRRPQLGTSAFIQKPLPAPGPEWHIVEIDRLANFFCHPAKVFLRDRLGLRLAQEADVLDEREPLEISSLARTQMQSRLAQRSLAAGDVETALRVLREIGELPAGPIGASRFRDLHAEVQPFVVNLRAALASPARRPLTLALDFGEWQVVGALQDLRDAHQIRARASAVKPNDTLRAWIYHLALNCAATGDDPRETLLLSTDMTSRFRAVPDAPALLADLLALYAEGLVAPLPFYSRTSDEFARRTLLPKKGKKDPLLAAWKIWAGGDFPEESDAHYALALRGVDEPLGKAWQQLTLRIFTPLFAHCGEVSV